MTFFLPLVTPTAVPRPPTQTLFFSPFKSVTHYVNNNTALSPPLFDLEYTNQLWNSIAYSARAQALLICVRRQLVCFRKSTLKGLSFLCHSIPVLRLVQGPPGAFRFLTPILSPVSEMPDHGFHPTGFSPFPNERSSLDLSPG